MIKNILFDLDGTLLNMDQDKFLELYMMSLYNYSKEEYKDIYELIELIKKGVYLMVNNNGEFTNEEVFYNHFKSFHKEHTDDLLKKYEKYYDSDFIITKKSTSLKSVAPLLIKGLKEKGYNLILATNPIFPRIATLNRIKWAGLNPDDFMYISTYENSHYSKPNIKYYEEILNKLNLNKEECLMVGNDTSEDYVITNLDIPCIILKENLINKNNLELDFSTLEEYYLNTKNYPKVK